MIGVRMRHIPIDSATVLATGGNGWGLRDFLLADIFHATVGEPHPGLPKQEKAADPAREKKIARARARARERQRAIDAGEII